MRLSELQGNSRSITIDCFGSPIHVTYKPNFITADVEESLNSISNGSSENRVRDLLTIICGVMTKWDVTDDDKVMVPVNPEAMAEAGVTLELANEILTGIMQDSTSANPKNSVS